MKIYGDKMGRSLRRSSQPRIGLGETLDYRNLSLGVESVDLGEEYQIEGRK
jgi:hypothetical protein